MYAYRPQNRQGKLPAIYLMHDDYITGNARPNNAVLARITPVQATTDHHLARTENHHHPSNQTSVFKPLNGKPIKGRLKVIYFQTALPFYFPNRAFNIPVSKSNTFSTRTEVMV